MKRTFLKFVLFLSLLLTACGPAVLVSPLTPTLIPPVTAPLPTAKLKATCPKQGNSDLPSVFPADDFELQKIMLTYINQGGVPEQLFKRLKEIDTKYNRFEVSRIDINGDGVNELLISRTLLEGGIAESVFWIFQCTANKYDVLYFNSYMNDPRVIAIADLNGDGQNEIVIQNEWLGSGCLEIFDIVELISASAIHFTGKLGLGFPCHTEFRLGGLDVSGNREILFLGTSDIRYDAVGYIQRDFVDTYVLKNHIYTLESHVYFPSPYRIYAIYDAQHALDDLDFNIAVQLYEKAAYDETLKDTDAISYSSPLYAETWPKNAPRKDYPKEYVVSFSLFRLMLLYIKSGQAQKTVDVLHDLDAKFPAGKPGSEFVDLANLFKKEFESSKGITLSCNAVADKITNKYPYLRLHFDWSTWTVFYYTDQTICPYSADVNWLRIK